MKKRIYSLLLAVVPLVLLLAGLPALAQSSQQGQETAKIEPLLLQELASEGQADFFVWMKDKADLSPAYRMGSKEEKGRFVYETLVATAERTQAGLRRYLDEQGIRYETFYIANKVLVYGGNQSLLTSVATRTDVEKLTANHQFQLQEPVEKNPSPLQIAAIEPNLTFIKADQAWALGYNGQGTVLAGNDTGLDETHPAIARHYRGCLNPPTCSSWDYNYNWWDATGTYPTNPADGHGHGTHTAGTMVGYDGGSNQIGVAPGAQTIHCKNMTDSGSGVDSYFVTCFQWDLAPWDLNHANPRPDLAPDAVNNSWGYGGGGQNQFRDEIQALVAAGIAVEVSAGNEGSGCATLRSPGDYNEVLTTGSVSHVSAWPGTITGFSSRGPSDLDSTPPYYFPDIMAPGENIRSSLPGGTYANWSGTSMAGPHATAFFGLCWSAAPALRGQVQQTIDIITANAAPLTGQNGSNCGGNYTTGPNNDWGRGTINALAVVQACLAYAPGPTPTPAPTQPTNTPNPTNPTNTPGPTNTPRPTGTPIPPTPVPTANPTFKIHVAAIDMWYTKSGANYYVYTRVTIVDGNNSLISNARVSVLTTLPSGKTTSTAGTTGTDGTVTLRVKSKLRGVYRSDVTGVTHPTRAYDPAANVETWDTVTVP